MQLTGRSFVKYGIFAAAAVAAYLTVGALAHADVSPIITTTIRNTSENVITTALVGSNVHIVVQVASSSDATVPQGTVDFQVYGNTTCTGSPTTQSNVALVNGFATSSASAVVAAGLSYKVHYDGSANNIAADGTCMSLTATSNTAAITNVLSNGTITAGATAYDAATLTNVTANAGGTVTYTVYSDNSCVTPFSGAGNKTVTNASVPNSDAITFNTPGTYYWRAVYSGDANNTAATSTCGSANLTVQAVAKNSPTLSTTLSTSTSVLVGSSIFDTVALSGQTGNAAGTVTFTIFTNNACTTLYGNAGSKTVTNGSVPSSDPFVFNAPGTYYWQAVYSGDAGNNAATSTCANGVLTVNAVPNPTKNSPTISTTLSSSSILTGTSVSDAATINGETANAGGTLTYKVFTNNSCTTLFANAGTKTVTNGNVGNSDSVVFNTAGTYYWQAVYSGDVGNNPATSTCTSEILTVQASGTPAPTGPGTISGTVFNDLDKDGVKDSDEVGLAGFTINLYNSAKFNNGKYDPVFKSAVTDGSGNYSFTSLGNGTYSVEQLKKTGWKQKSEDFKSVVISAGEGKTGLNFAEVEKKNDNGKNNGKHKKDYNDNDSDDNTGHSSSTKDWFKKWNKSWNWR